MSQITKGYAVATSYTKVLDPKAVRLNVELQNQTGGDIHVYVGESTSTPNDNDAILVGREAVWYPSVPITNALFVRAVTAGNVVILTNGV